MSDNREWKVGDYAMSRGMAVRVEDIGGHVNTLELVADYRHGAGITCGGHSSSGQSLDHLEPITDPEIILLVRAYEAHRLIKQAERTIMEQKRVLEAQTAGLRALQDAMAASVALKVEAASSEATNA